MEFIHNIQGYILAFGYIGIFTTLFAESGFFLGFFLPGDSLLFTIGLLSSQGIFSFWYLLPIVIAGAVLGDSFGYYTGRRLGPWIFNRPDSLFFKKRYLEQTEEFYKIHGKKTIILARFVPIVRTFAPIFAGMGAMEYSTFISYNVIGGTAWSAGFLSIGYFLGRRIPNIEDYLSYIILGIVFISVLPLVYEIVKNYRKKQ